MTARMNQKECDAAVKILLDQKVDLARRERVRRALDKTSVIPAIARCNSPVYEAFISWCLESAKLERLKRMLRRELH